MKPFRNFIVTMFCTLLILSVLIILTIFAVKLCRILYTLFAAGLFGKTFQPSIRPSFIGVITQSFMRELNK